MFQVREASTEMGNLGLEWQVSDRNAEWRRKGRNLQMDLSKHVREGIEEVKQAKGFDRLVHKIS